MKIIKILGIRYKLTIVVLVISITGFVVGCGSSEREMLGDDDYEFTFVADAGSTPTVAVSDVPFEEPTVEPIVEPTEEPVIEEVNLETISLAKDLYDTMIAALGIGLAAPQVGISKTLCIINNLFCLLITPTARCNF